MPAEFPAELFCALTRCCVFISHWDGWIKLNAPSVPAQYIRLLGTAPCSRGISVPRRFTILGPLPAPSAGVSDITDLYVEKYDAPPVGSRIFIRTLQIINGWQDLPKQTTATVPAS